MWLDVHTRAVLPDGLQCRLYLFGRADQAEDFRWQQTVDFREEDTQTVAFPLMPDDEYTYRLLFVAYNPERDRVTVSGASMTDSQWADVRIAIDTPRMSEAIYYHIRDVNQAELKATEQLHATLTRLVGQTVVDIFRLQDPKAEPRTVSVVDRVERVTIHYTGLTRELAFDPQGNPRPTATWERQTQELRTTMDEDDFYVLMPQLDNGWMLASPTSTADQQEGSARLMGLCGLPTDGGVEMECTFVYHDTNPITDPDTGLSDYAEKTLTLRLLPTDIQADTYSVHRAGIRFNRIIDLPASSGCSIDIAWETQP
jgi:hypothetical protein